MICDASLRGNLGVAGLDGSKPTFRKSAAVGIDPRGRMVDSTGFVSLDMADHGESI